MPIYGSNGQIIGFRPLTAADVNGFLLGGYGTVLSQIFSRNFPNYSAQVSLTIPLRNRAAQADLITDELNYRQSEIQDKQLHNNIKLNVINAYTTMRQARAAYETSVVARKLQDETLAGMRRKYELGTSTITDVVVAQRDATTRQLGRSGCAPPIYRRANVSAPATRHDTRRLQREYRRGQGRTGGARGRYSGVVTATSRVGEPISVGAVPAILKLARIYPFQPYRYTRCRRSLAGRGHAALRQDHA